MMATTIIKAAPMELFYRPATIDQAPLIQSLITNGFRASDTRANWTGDSTRILNETFSIPLSAIETAITSDTGMFMLVFTNTTTTTTISSQEEEIVGCFNLAQKSASKASIAWFVIAHNFQQVGVGRRVLAYAEKYARTIMSDVEVLELNALSSREELISWYERCGYVRTGLVVAFPRESVDAEIPDGVGFVYLEKSLR
jgi:ribosomal protein S18 acetylase RimI-like enzyme